MITRYAKIDNDIIVQTQPNKETGFIELSTDAVCGMVYKNGVLSSAVKSSQEIASETEADAKILRFKKIAAITVGVDGMVFDANEISQSRISIRISSMSANTDKARWKLADNTWTDVTKAQFFSVLALAAVESTKIMGG